MVEVAGIEPASESISIEATTCLSSAFLECLRTVRRLFQTMPEFEGTVQGQL